MNNLIDKINKEFLLDNYSIKTRKAYLLYIKEYICFCNKYKFKNKQVAVEKYILNKHKQDLAPQTINLALNAVKFLYFKVFKDKEKINIKCVKKNKKLPVYYPGKKLKKSSQ